MCFKSRFYPKCKSYTFGGWWILTGKHRWCVSVMGVNSFARTSRTCLVSLIIVLRSIGVFWGDVMLNLSRQCFCRKTSPGFSTKAARPQCQWAAVILRLWLFKVSPVAPSNSESRREYFACFSLSIDYVWECNSAFKKSTHMYNTSCWSRYVCVVCFPLRLSRLGWKSRCSARVWPVDVATSPLWFILVRKVQTCFYTFTLHWSEE